MPESFQFRSYSCILWHVALSVNPSGADVGVFRDNYVKIIIADALAPPLQDHQGP